MKIDLTKYDNIIFHNNEKINKKVKVYMLIFDYQSELGGLSTEGKIELLNHWEKVFMKEEFYEIIPSLIYRKSKLDVKIKYDKLSVVRQMAHKLSDIIVSLCNKKK